MFVDEANRQTELRHAVATGVETHGSVRKGADIVGGKYDRPREVAAGAFAALGSFEIVPLILLLGTYLIFRYNSSDNHELWLDVSGQRGWLATDAVSGTRGTSANVNAVRTTSQSVSLAIAAPAPGTSATWLCSVHRATGSAPNEAGRSSLSSL